MMPNLSWAQCGPDQSIVQSSFDTNIDILDGFEIGQSFVAPCDGSIEGVSMDLFPVATFGQAILRIYDGAEGTTVLATETIDVTSGGSLFISLSTPLAVTGGNSYTFGLTEDELRSNYTISNTNSYLEGSMLVSSGQQPPIWTVEGGSDLFFTVHFSDLTAPTAICQDTTVLLDASGNATIVAADVDNGSSDDSGTVTLSVSPSSFTCANLGTNTVTLTATDPSGNMSTCDATVTVLDILAPVLTCPDDIVIDCSEVVNYTLPTFTDNCSAVIAPSAIPGFMVMGTIGSSTYYLSDVAVDGPTAFANAATLGYELVTIGSLAENNFVRTEASALGAADVFLGYNDVNNEGTFVWQSGLPTTFINWNTEEPNNVGNEDYTTMQMSGRWNDIGVTAMARYVLELNSNIEQVAGLPSGSIFPAGTTTNTFRVSDASGNTATCSFNVIVNDNTPPVLTCQDDIISECGDGIIFATPSPEENCPVAAVPSVVPGFTLLGTRSNSTYFISDENLPVSVLFSNAEAYGYNIVSIQDIDENTFVRAQASALGAQDILMGYNDIATEGSFVWQSEEQFSYTNWGFDEPNNTDGNEHYVVLNNEGEWNDVPEYAVARSVIEFYDGVVQVAGVPSGSTFPFGTTTNTFYYRDTAGNATSCSFDVIVTDDTLPILSCPVDIVVSNDPEECGALVSIPIPMVTDNCGDFIPSDFGSITPLNFDIDGELIDTPTVFENAATETNNVTMELNYKGDFTTNDECFELVGPDGSQVFFACNMVDNNDCSSIVNPKFTIPQTTWNSWVSIFGSSLTFTLLADANVDNGGCGNEGPENNFYQLIKRNSNVIVHNDFTNTDNASGFYPLGTTTIVWTAIDQAGNTATCSQTITVNDTEAPVVSCSGDITVNNDPNACQAVVNYDLPTAIDNCSTFGTTLNEILLNFDTNYGDVTNLIPDAYNFTMDGPGGVNATYISDGDDDMYDDGNFISTNLSANPIMYSDNTIVVSTDFGPNGAYFTRKIDNMWVMVADLDGINDFDITGELGADGEGIADGFTSTITVDGVNYNLFVKRVREQPGGAGSDPSVNHLIIIPENTAVSHNFTTDTDDDQHQVTGLAQTTRLYYLLYASLDSGLVDNATTESIASEFLTSVFMPTGTIVQTTGLPSGSTFPVGTTTNTFVATDESGNTSTCSFDVTVIDTIAPTIACPGDQTQERDSNCEAILDDFTSLATASDNCVLQTMILNHEAPLTTTNLQYFGGSSDGNLNQVVANPDPSGINTSAMVGEFVKVGDAPSWAGAFTNPDPTIPVNLNGATQVCVKVRMDHIGNLALKLENSSSGGANWIQTRPNSVVNEWEEICFDISLNSEEDPFLPAVDQIYSRIVLFFDLGVAGTGTDVTNYFDDIVVTSSSGLVVLSQNPPAGTVITENTAVTLSATDAAGNISACTFNVLLEDNENPIVVCQDITIQLDDSGMASIVVDDIDGGSTDNCGIASAEIDINTFDCSNIGANNVLLTITDINGNEASCTAVVTVEDSVAPITVCQDLTVQLDASGTATIVAADVDGGSSDNCAIASLEIDVDTFDCSHIGANDVTLTVTDASGNQSSCVAVVTVEDTTPPQLVCMDVTVELGADGTATIIPDDVIDTLTDGCEIATTAVDVTSFDCSDVGNPVTVNVFVSDSNGNTSSCTAVVTVVDVTGPIFDEATLPAKSVTRQANDENEYVLEDFTVGVVATDNCEEIRAPVIQDPAPGEVLTPGVYTITLSSVDGLGNSQDYEFELIVESILAVGDETSMNTNILIYPNPARNVVNLSNPQAIILDEVQIFDLSGRLVYTADLTDMGIQKTLDVSALSSATYVVLIKGRVGTLTLQLIKN